ncbi:MAG: mRNA surveillance protein pelota [Nanoarchaeota archaeon]
MKVIKKDLKKGFAKIQISSEEDLWFLSHIIDINDKIKSVTYRKIKVGNDESSKSVKKKFVLKINVEKIEFHKYSNALRISGKIIEAPEDISLGSYHTINLEVNTIFSIEKEKFYDYQLKKLKEAETEKKLGILICVFDREECIFALMKNYGFEILTEFKGEMQKKYVDEKIDNKKYYKNIIEVLKDYSTKYNINKIVVASPSFFKDYLLNEIKDDYLKKKIISANCNNTGIQGINEVLRRPEIITALSEDRIVNETKAVEELLTEIKKEKNYVYGFNETKKAVDLGAVKELLVTDNLIKKTREDNTFSKLDNILKTTESINAKIRIISSDHEAGKKLEGLGGIGAILRYKV